MIFRTRSELLQIIEEFCKSNNLTMQPESSISPGDFYVACRNAGPKLLECKSVDTRGLIYPTEIAYVYGEAECVKIIFNP